ncbi:MAG: hypothetical protein RLZZ522_381, partial [Verrucomicrobiota bacterium]
MLYGSARLTNATAAPMSVLLYLLPLGLIFDLIGYLPPSLR